MSVCDKNPLLFSNQLIDYHTSAIYIYISFSCHRSPQFTTLRSFLHDRHVPGITDPLCSCGNGPEDPRHIFTACPDLVAERSQLAEQVGPIDLRGGLSDPKRAHAMAKWFLRLGRVEYYDLASRLIANHEETRRPTQERRRER